MKLPDNGPLRGLCIIAILLAMAILAGAVVHRVRRELLAMGEALKASTKK